jgi:hypothetical protein
MATTALQQTSGVSYVAHAEMIQTMQVRRKTVARNDCAGKDQPAF